MSAERNDLAHIIWGHPSNLDSRPSIMVDANSAHLLAKKIEEAGYRKPRTVTTVEELAALPVGSILNTDAGAWEKVADPDDADVITFWLQAGNRRWNPSRDVTLPATVLHEPEAS